MKRLAPLLAALFFALAGSAWAHGFSAGGALLRAGAQFAKVADVQPSCPAGVPVQTITVVNQANVRPSVLGRIERDVASQSVQVCRHWGTPLVRFGSGGWKLYLAYSNISACDTETGDQGCHAYDANGVPFAAVDTWGGTWQVGQGTDWSAAFDHEIVEMVTDEDANPAGEVVDPVNNDVYQVDDGSMMSDFVYPSYFQPGASGPYDLEGEVHAPLSDPSGD